MNTIFLTSHYRIPCTNWLGHMAVVTSTKYRISIYAISETVHANCILTFFFFVVNMGGFHCLM